MFKPEFKRPRRRKSQSIDDRGLLKEYLWKYRRWIGIGLFALAVVDVIEILPPLFLKRVVDIVVERRPAYLLLHMALAYLGISLVQGVCRYAWRMFLIRSSIWTGRDLRTKYAGHLFGLSVSFFDRCRLGDMMSLATNDVEAVRMAVGTGLLVFADALFYLMTVPIAMYLMSPKLTLLACLPLPIVPWIVMRNEKAVHERFEKVQECFGKISALTQENLNGIRVVKTFARENTQFKRIRELGEEYIRLNLKLARVQTAMGPILDFVMSMGMVVLLFVGGRSIITGASTGTDAAISLGTFVAFQRYIQKMIWPMAAVGMSANYYQRAISSSKRLNAIFSISSDVPESANPVSPHQKSGKIEFRNLNFSFPGSYGSQGSQNASTSVFPTLPVLSEINLEIAPGERVAFVGMVGSGKSAILSLLPRIYPIQRGMILIDGIDINDWPLNDLRKQVGYVSQDIFLFSESVVENVAFGLHEWVTEKVPTRVEEATRLSSVHEDILGFSSAYNTRIGERGVNLSGGQKQRLTIARALAKNPSILVLDDALSSVDVQTEEKILQGLRSRPSRNTELIAAHRISTIQDADRIVVLNRGKISQMGTHSQLVSQRTGEYWKFYEQQRLKEDLENYQNELS